ncbi:MAG: hypothetical protein C4563_06620 [Desulfobulbus sp.]|nr:MAG: hypothetical protein C4563_06620 [Desulfobulbus sp.]
MLPLNRRTLATAGALLILSATSALADDVTDSLNDALTKYNNGQYTEAITSLNYAEQLITQKKGEALTEVFPEPLAGWQAEEVQADPVFGGGISAERRYNSENASVTIAIVSDSPMLQATMMLFTNPMFATADGGKLETISGQKAIVKYSAENKSGEIQTVVNNRFLVTVTGSEVAKDVMTAYLGNLDVNKLGALK